MRALTLHAGPRARQRLLDGGLRPQEVRVIPAAAGGPKGLVLNPLDRYLFGHWMAGSTHDINLLGASIGAWRMACATLHDADAALAELAEDYITLRYEHAPGKAPTPTAASRSFGDKLEQRLGRRAAEVLASPRYRLHVFTSHGRHLLRRQGRIRTPLGYLGAFISNATSRRALGLWLERVVFSDPRSALPFGTNDFRTRRVELTTENLAPSILASCSIPFWLDAVHDLPGAPRGAYWDGGITDYHLHLDYASMTDGLVLYPHFQSNLVPGWLDKPFKRRQAASPSLDNVLLLSPSAEWVATLPLAKLPDRSDFRRFGDDEAARIATWRRALAESQRLADDFADWVGGASGFEIRPL
ncbi:MAG: phospholipase [Rubrivivax sp.]|nr:phospholipase [Rubrivivax sp.]